MYLVSVYFDDKSNKIISEMSKDDFNINVKFVDERDDFCIIYYIDIE